MSPSWQDVENIAALPVEAAEAEAMLRDNANLLQARGEAGVEFDGCSRCCSALCQAQPC